ncbi:MAG: RDD family protein [Solirubrobacterales bacterium]
MDNGSTPRSAAGRTAANGAAASDAAARNGAAQNGAAAENGNLPLSARLLGVGVRGARSVGKATGIDKAVEVAAEEAIVTAVESEAVERAIARVLEGPIVEEAVQGALQSEAVKRAILEAMDSELVDEVWRRLLASEEAQQLVERIAGAPEVRAAISAQGVGLIEDIGRSVGRLLRRLDDTVENIARRIFFRKRRVLPSAHAGLLSRALAYVIDGVFVNFGFAAAAALVTLVIGIFSGGGSGGTSYAIAIGSTVWVAIGSLYLIVFWALAGQTPGMRFVGIRLAGGDLPPRRCLRRLLGLYLSVITLGIGFLGIVFRENRRAWEDRFSDSDVIYDERRPEPAPWSAPVPPPVAADAARAEGAVAAPGPTTATVSAAEPSVATPAAVPPSPATPAAAVPPSPAAPAAVEVATPAPPSGSAAASAPAE